jgi:osmotically-inducible protein OsmY
MISSTSASRPLVNSSHPRTQSPANSDKRTRNDSDGHAAPRGHRLRPLQERVLAALVDSGYAALSYIGCDVDQDCVILRGSVPSYHLKQLAQVYAQRVDDIVRVENRLEVRGLRPR